MNFILMSIFKKYIPTLLLSVLIMVAGVSASIWFLDGWSAFFSSVGVILLSIVGLISAILISISKIFGVTGELKNFILRKKTKEEFMASLVQGGSMYFLSTQMGGLFSNMPTNIVNNNLNIGGDVNTVKSIETQESKLEENHELVGTEVSKLDENAMLMEAMNNPEIQKQMMDMMQMMFGGLENGENSNNSNGEMDLSKIMNMFNEFEDDNEDDKSVKQIGENKDNKNDIEDVEIKK